MQDQTSFLLRFLGSTEFRVPDSLLNTLETALESDEKDLGTLICYNEFRIANLPRMKKKRPQVLIGSSFVLNYPNLHIYPLLQVADVVCINTIHSDLYLPSIIRASPHEKFTEILKRLPEGFKPDFYWDNQVELQHRLFPGMEEAPFPLIASVCHMYYTLSVEAVYSLFDRVIPISPAFIPLMDKKFPGKSLNIPFGLNWNSFNQIVKPNYNKKIDVCVTFTPTTSPEYRGMRDHVIGLVERFKKKYGNKYSIEILQEKLTYTDYFQLLSDSLITVNTVGLHGPYNYKNLEAIANGSMIFQYDWKEGPFESRFEGFFKDSVHGVSFTDATFEEKLLYYLEHKEEAIRIAKQAWAFTEENISHGKLHLQLIEEAKKIQVPKERPKLNSVDRIYFYQCRRTSLHLAESGHVPIPWIQANNEMVVERRNYFLAFEHYKEALKSCPSNCRWLLEWNFYLTRKQFNIPHDTALLRKLLEEEPPPFDEELLLFKYDIDQRDLFLHWNIHLLASFDKPLERAKHYQNYCKWVLEK